MIAPKTPFTKRDELSLPSSFASSTPSLIATLGRDAPVDYELVDGKTQKVAVDAGKLGDGPRRGLGLDMLVQGLTVVQHACDQFLGEAPAIPAQGNLREAPGGACLRGMPGHVRLVQDLEGHHAGPAAGRQVCPPFFVGVRLSGHCLRYGRHIRRHDYAAIPAMALRSPTLVVSASGCERFTRFERTLPGPIS